MLHLQPKKIPRSVVIKKTKKSQFHTRRFGKQYPGHRGGKKIRRKRFLEKKIIIFWTSVGRFIPPNTDRNSVITEFHFNNNANVNVVNQNFAFEHDLTKIENLLFRFE